MDINTNLMHPSMSKQHGCLWKTWLIQTSTWRTWDVCRAGAAGYTYPRSTFSVTVAKKIQRSYQITPFGVIGTACFSNTHYRYAKTCWGVGIFLKPSSPGATFSSCNFKSLILNPVKKTCPGSQLNSDTSAIFPESSHSSVCRLLLIFLFHCQSDYLTADMLNKPSCVFPLRLPSRSLLSWVCPGRRCSQ